MLMPVHVYSVDRATQTARLGGVNPVRKYVRGDDFPVIVQLVGGSIHFYDQGGQPLSIDDVPQDVLEDLQRNPLRRGSQAIEQVIRFCEFCPRTATGDMQPVASGEYEAHLKEHLRQQAVAAQAVSERPEKYQLSETAVLREATRRAEAEAETAADEGE